MGTHPIFESDFDCLTETKMPFVIATCAAIAGYVAPSLGLSAMRFTASGVAAGSAAAAIQSGIGAVAAGSTFAAAQSAGVLGVPAIISATSGVVAGAAAMLF